MIPDKAEQAVILQEAKLLADAVVSAQASTEESKLEAPLRIDIAINGLEKLLEEVTIHVKQHVS